MEDVDRPIILLYSDFSLLSYLGDHMKLCIDCLWFLPSELPDPHHSLAKCAVSYSIHPVNGVKSHAYCSDERLFSFGKCTLKGINFQPKEINHE
jgi:hypothetical protein